MVQICPKATLLDFLPEGPVGSGNETDVYWYRYSRPDSEYLSVFKYSQERGLAMWWQLAQLIEKEGAPIGRLDEPFAIPRSISKCASYVPKKFTCE
jgi:hypothetical protein